MSLMEFARSLKSGLIVPKQQEVAVQCEFCPALIWKHKESKGRLFLHNGKPICARCRILKGSRLAKMIRGDRKEFERDQAAHEKVLQHKADLRVEEAAIDSRNRHPDVAIPQR